MLITNMSPERIWNDLLCFIHLILYDPGLHSHPESCILSLCASRLKLIYSPGWRGRLLTKTGTSGGGGVDWKNKDLTLLSLDNLSWDLAVNVKLSECSWEASHGVCSRDGAASGVQPGPCVHNRWKPLLPAPQWISSKHTYTYTPPPEHTHLVIYPFISSFHFSNRSFKSDSTAWEESTKDDTDSDRWWVQRGWIACESLILPSVGHRFNPDVRVSMSPPPGSRGVLYWEWFLLRHLPEVLQHGRKRRGLLLHRHFLRSGRWPLLTLIEIKPKKFKAVF